MKTLWNLLLIGAVILVAIAACYVATQWQRDAEIHRRMEHLELMVHDLQLRVDYLEGGPITGDLSQVVSE